MNDVFEHIPVDEAENMLSLLKNALVPGGTLVLRVPNMSNILGAYSRFIDITHVTGYTEESLQQLLTLAGFRNHTLVLPPKGFVWRSWRPWAPWCGWNLRDLLNTCLHRFLFFLRYSKAPQCVTKNIEVYTHRPLEDPPA
ncbi:hypothetical protein CALK_2461 [Chitinivibrio alkaliphilus ACht1]|uniref:Uncharacterized protein n=1 Tax=Chitinivibrio alkaliphilus ACht1 TaxID=1313304 RepID=U7D436_9BACT|nr:hypothetical protein CALK_2461 [Chitinivibrio alkaliphilus ACht1]